MKIGRLYRLKMDTILYESPRGGACGKLDGGDVVLLLDVHVSTNGTVKIVHVMSENKRGWFGISFSGELCEATL